MIIFEYSYARYRPDSSGKYVGEKLPRFEMFSGLNMILYGFTYLKSKVMHLIIPNSCLNVSHTRLIH
jgi:hypothetical protein